MQKEELPFVGATRKSSRKEDRLAREALQASKTPGSYIEKAKREQMEKYQPVNPSIR